MSSGAVWIKLVEGFECETQLETKQRLQRATYASIRLCILNTL